ncbi:hypothetical protein NGB36_04235 [Streptomyces sp. RB6PN25]|uniref:Uncharacterized protein n=1 Tax=Streptomyces humicola TaxID=2953240 RepID=A0ABT1PQ68_9ACTN|nr:hypothetical protein [Streptomyces humicola]MCQ4079819.1 hypothetical protein [Streptomyces humicola]
MGERGPDDGGTTPRALLRTVVAAVLVAVATCSSGRASPPSSGTPATPLTVASGTRHPAPLQPGDWPTRHRDPARTGAAPGLPAQGVLRH